jgi:hypothetical protein
MLQNMKRVISLDSQNIRSKNDNGRGIAYTNWCLGGLLLLFGGFYGALGFGQGMEFF